MNVSCPSNWWEEVLGNVEEKKFICGKMSILIIKTRVHTERQRWDQLSRSASILLKMTLKFLVVMFPNDG